MEVPINERKEKLYEEIEIFVFTAYSRSSYFYSKYIKKKYQRVAE